LRLETISPALAARIVSGDSTNQDFWHPEYPLADELDPLRSLADATPNPVFTMYMIRQVSDGLAIGGLGFFGAPDSSGYVEIGYGLVPAARGARFATEAVRAALQLAAHHGATAVTANTEVGNGASQRVLLNAGFIEVRRNERMTFFARPLGSPFSPVPPVVYEIDGSAVNNLDDLYRLLGEAVHGPGGYFGVNLDALGDCLNGGFGTPEDRNFLFVLHRSGRAITALGSARRSGSPIGFDSRPAVDDGGIRWLPLAKITHTSIGDRLPGHRSRTVKGGQSGADSLQTLLSPPRCDDCE
jgi:RimJ/RimL family protein N-acetyltransferase